MIESCSWIRFRNNIQWLDSKLWSKYCKSAEIQAVETWQNISIIRFACVAWSRNLLCSQNSPGIFLQPLKNNFGMAFGFDFAPFVKKLSFFIKYKGAVFNALTFPIHVLSLITSKADKVFFIVADQIKGKTLLINEFFMTWDRIPRYPKIIAFSALNF